jgi:TolB-like protein
MQAISAAALILCIGCASAGQGLSPTATGNVAAAQPLISQGIDSYQRGDYDAAARQLAQARALVPSYSPAALYLGLAYLRQGATAQAISAWRDYTELPPSTDEERRDDVDTTVADNLSVLMRAQNELEARAAIARELKLGRNQPPQPDVIAVTYYEDLGPAEIAPLGKGLTALVISDLSRVSQLRVVERGELQALRDELALSKAGLTANPATIGALLAAGKVDTGSYSESGQNILSVQSRIVMTINDSVVGTEQASGQLDNFYAIEKTLAFAMLRDLGYTPTRLGPAEVDAIAKPQTTSLPAFVAYSRGLDASDHGQKSAAAADMARAVRDDPNFALARQALLFLQINPGGAGSPAGEQRMRTHIARSIEAKAPPRSSVIASMGAMAKHMGGQNHANAQTGPNPNMTQMQNMNSMMRMPDMMNMQGNMMMGH